MQACSCLVKSVHNAISERNVIALSCGSKSALIVGLNATKSDTNYWHCNALSQASLDCTNNTSESKCT